MSLLDKFRKKQAKPKTIDAGRLKDAAAKDKTVVPENKASKKQKVSTVAKISEDNRNKKNSDKSQKAEVLAEHQNILVRPLISEKSAALGTFNQYVFEVSPAANKITIKKAIREVYGVSPTKVRVLSQSGKLVRSGKVTGVTKFRKKAVVTLSPGDKIQVFEGV
jgi:large subunit ribosomal protein L23